VASGLEIVLPAFYISEDAELRAPLEPLWDKLRGAGLEIRGTSFWIRIR